MKQTTTGETRQGPGRPRKEPTRNIQFRVPESKADFLKIEILKLIRELLRIAVK